MSYASEQGVLNAQWNAAEAAFQAEMQRQRPFMLLRPAIMRDGDKWCALYGENLVEGVAGFGDTPEMAAFDFDKNWNEERIVKQGPDWRNCDDCDFRTTDPDVTVCPDKQCRGAVG